jgi:hypothetical protein
MIVSEMQLFSRSNTTSILDLGERYSKMNRKRSLAYLTLVMLTILVLGAACTALTVGGAVPSPTPIAEPITAPAEQTKRSCGRTKGSEQPR